MKTCNKCNLTKPLEGFYTGTRYADGYRPICKACVSVKTTGKTTEQRELLKFLRSEKTRLKQQALDRRINKLRISNSLLEQSLSTPVAKPVPAWLDQVIDEPKWTRDKLHALSPRELLVLLDPMEPEDEDEFRKQFGIAFDEDNLPYLK